MLFQSLLSDVLRKKGQHKGLSWHSGWRPAARDHGGSVAQNGSESLASLHPMLLGLHLKHSTFPLSQRVRQVDLECFGGVRSDTANQNCNVDVILKNRVHCEATKEKSGETSWGEGGGPTESLFCFSLWSSGWLRANILFMRIH